MYVETPEDHVTFKLLGLIYMENRQVEILEWFAEQTKRDSLDDIQDGGGPAGLEETFREHREQTREHVNRLDRTVDTANMRIDDLEMPSIDAVVTEAERYDNLLHNDELRGPYLAEAGLRLERAEATIYENLLDLAERIGMEAAAIEPLEATLQEERETAEDFRRHANQLFDRAITG